MSEEKEYENYNYYNYYDTDVNKLISYKKKKVRKKKGFKKFISIILALTISGVAIPKLSSENYKEKLEDLYSGFVNYLDNNLNIEYNTYEEQNYDEEFINEVSNLYDEATTYVSDLYKDLELDSSLECYYVYNYLDDNGYLSYDNYNAKYSDEDYLDLCDYDALGADVLYKKSYCRHEADFYCNTLNKYNIDAITSVCYMGKELEANDIIEPNHEIVVVNEKGVVTYQDTLNNEIFDKYDIDYEDRVSSQTSDNFLIMMPDKSSSEYKNIICTKNTDEETKKLTSWINHDDDGVDYEYVLSEYEQAKEKINEHLYDIYEFNNTYTQNIKNKLPR